MLEVIGFTIEGCSTAERAGAGRIELCDNPGEGGTTPSYGFIKAVRQVLTIPLFPIIRPRGGDFLYTDEEFQVIKSDVLVCKQLDCDGIVTGMLTRNGEIDVERIQIITTLAYPMEVAFHRAFDRVKEPVHSLEILIAAGCTRILTSGLKPDALQGAAKIKELITHADDRIIIMPGSGVRSDNIQEIKSTTGATEFHSSARVKKGSLMEYQNEALREELQSFDVDEREVTRMVEVINNNG